MSVVKDQASHAEELRGLVDGASVSLGARPLTGDQFLAVMDSYCNKARTFHGLDHGWQMAFLTPADKESLQAIGPDSDRLIPLITLGGFYHDAAYVQVDGIPPRMSQVLSRYMNRQGEGLLLRDDVAGAHREVYDIVCGMFDMRPAASLCGTAAGCQPANNEFLSALITADQLHEQGHTPATSPR